MFDRFALEERLADAQEDLMAHPLYEAIETREDLRFFMECHVWAVWDFMSLVKDLQRSITSLQVPWYPSPIFSAQSVRLINKIVLDEESDSFVSEEGEEICTSHLDLYLAAMQEVGACTRGMEANLQDLSSTMSSDQGDRLLLGPIQERMWRRMEGACGHSAWIPHEPERMERHGLGAYELSSSSSLVIPEPALDFVEGSFEVLRDASLAGRIAYFTYGREDPIPQMFQHILDNLDLDAPLLKLYLERHIALDGEDHGPAAHRLLEEALAKGQGTREEAMCAAIEAVEQRIRLWDSILLCLRPPPTM